MLKVPQSHSTATLVFTEEAPLLFVRTTNAVSVQLLAYHSMQVMLPNFMKAEFLMANTNETSIITASESDLNFMYPGSVFSASKKLVPSNYFAKHSH